MTNRLLLIAALLITSCTLWAQQSAPVMYTVKGILVDSLTNEAEPYATIRITKKENPDQAVKMAVTDNNGKFQENVTGSGDYLMTITSIGKTIVKKEFSLKPEEKTKDLGTLYTNDESNELANVEIVAQKPLVKVDIDKIEYNIEDDPDSKTNSLLEMLRKVPLVTVDGEDNIQVNGSSNFKVHVNGKPNNMMSDNPTEVLKSMPANSIKHIEVITSPGAKYDAEGVGGILNIVTVGGGFEGYTATFGVNASNMGLGSNVYATIKQNKLTITGNYGINQYRQPRSYNLNEYHQELAGTMETSEGWNKSKNLSQRGSLEASYELDTLRLLSFSFGLYGYGGDNNGETDTRLEKLGHETNELIHSYKQFAEGDNSWYSIYGGFDYQRLFSVKDRMLTFSYRLNSRPRTSDYYITYQPVMMGEDWDGNFWLRNQHRDGEENTTEHTFQTDFVTPLNKYHTIETGMKYIIRNSKSDDDLYYEGEEGKYILDAERSSHYKHLNDILAVYAGYSVRYKSLMGKAGLRYEHTMQDVKYKNTPERNFDANFNDVVPSASIGWKLAQTQNLRLSYDMRIWRPHIYYLNPYLDDSNPTWVRQGNPNLESEKNHRFQLSYSSFTQKFNINMGLNHSFTNNAIENITELRDMGGSVAGEKISYSTFENIGKNTHTNLSTYVNWNATSQTRIFVNANGGYSSYEGASDVEGKSKLKNNGWSMFAYGGVQHTFPKDIRVGLSLMTATPQISLQGRSGSFYDYGINLNKSFMNKRLTLSAFANNVFTKYMNYNNTTYGEGFTRSMENKFSRRRYGVSVSYRIGELRAQVKKAARTISNDDVKSGGESGGGE